MATPPTLGDRLKKAREDKGLTVRLLAGKAGIAPSTITKIERGQREASLVMVGALARALGISEVWLRMGNGSMAGDAVAPDQATPSLESALGDLAGEMRRHHESVGKILNAIEAVRFSMDRARADRLRQHFSS